ncbi:uncharacterized protein BXZ73DRAFT_77491 [Epithele typhae]|uniref:uncharacterized protein n=1 Tax=Epithele typhae TaxID=378194 RepID=UPI002007290C|nr:uncharacterized protein BXZ73DRAFT_77491 [Epithele typhae]KAH9932797.1 hypothetical protein BXZ73DRAFT_77491 [Epithele typhae]
MLRPLRPEALCPPFPTPLIHFASSLGIKMVWWHAGRKTSRDGTLGAPQRERFGARRRAYPTGRTQPRRTTTRWGEGVWTSTAIALPHNLVPAVPPGGGLSGEHAKVLDNMVLNKIILKVTTGVADDHFITPVSSTSSPRPFRPSWPPGPSPPRHPHHPPGRDCVAYHTNVTRLAASPPFLRHLHGHVTHDIR